MKYMVLVTDSAGVELDEAYEWLVAQTQQHAPRWYNGLLEAILSLEEMPGRCPLAVTGKTAMTKLANWFMVISGTGT